MSPFAPQRRRRRCPRHRHCLERPHRAGGQRAATRSRLIPRLGRRHSPQKPWAPAVYQDARQTAWFREVGEEAGAALPLAAGDCGVKGPSPSWTAPWPELSGPTARGRRGLPRATGLTLISRPRQFPGWGSGRTRKRLGLPIRSHPTLPLQEKVCVWGKGLPPLVLPETLAPQSRVLSAPPSLRPCVLGRLLTTPDSRRMREAWASHPEQPWG